LRRCSGGDVVMLEAATQPPREGDASIRGAGGASAAVDRGAAAVGREAAAVMAAAE